MTLDIEISPQNSLLSCFKSSNLEFTLKYVFSYILLNCLLVMGKCSAGTESCWFYHHFNNANTNIY